MKKIITLILLSFFTNSIFAQDYNKLAESAAKEQKIAPEHINNFKINYINNLKNIILANKKDAFRTNTITDICDDGGFEAKDFSSWGWTIIDNRKVGTNIVFNSIKTGVGSLLTSAISSTTALSQWEIVTSGFDDLFPTLPKVHSGNKALKLGRKESPSILPYCSAETIEKTINITAINKELTFWYALVLQDPYLSANKHNVGEAPAFGIRVKTGTTYSYLPILPVVGSGTSPIEALNNPFLINSIPSPYTETIAMRPWTCGRVDLSSYVNQTITIQFVINDCMHAGHFGYVYLDDICLGCTGSDMGDASITGISKDCGKDALVNGSYTLPHSSSVTGTLNSLQAQLYQGGLPFGSPITISSTYINTGTKTFNFPMSLFGTVPLGNYDIVVKANFTFSGSTYSTTSPTTGFITGINNDWKSECPQTDLNCCKNTLQMVTASLVPPSYPYNEGTYSVEKYNITIPNNVPITEVKVNVTSFEWKSDKEDCKQCQIKPVNLGSLYGGFSIGGTFVGPTSQPYGTGIGATSNNNELVFSFPSGKNFVVGDFMRLTYLLPPEKDLSCCQTKAKVCFKISWKDINCGYCEVFTCSDIDLKNPSELKAGFPLPDRLMLYLNSRNLFVTGHADGF